MLTENHTPELLQGTIDAIEDAIKIVAPDHKILYANKSAERQLGKTCDEMQGGLCYFETRGRSEPCTHCALRTVVETEQFQHVTFTTDDQNGQAREYEQYVYPLRDAGGVLIGAVEVTRDVTDKRAFERQMLQSEKMAALGQLSTSIAHEIRNPLTGIKLGIDSLLDQATPGEEQETLEAVSEDIRRLDRVLTELLDFARSKEPHFDLVKVNEVIARALFFVRKQAEKQKVEIRLRQSEELPEVRANPDQLKQVLLNIFLNALQVMPNGGILRIAADRLTHGGCAGVLIAVQDTGGGFPEEARRELFEAFFSTKPEGSGLGLAVSSRIIAQHGGAIWVESPPGMGALVNIFLPAEPVEQKA